MRLGITATQGLWIALLCLAAIVMSSYSSYFEGRRLLAEKAEQYLSTSAQVFGRRFTMIFQEIATDVKLLASLPENRKLLTALDTTTATGTEQFSDNQAQLSEIFTAMLSLHPEYYQIRLIGASQYGREVVRVDRNDDQLVRIEGKRLQEKGHYPYVFKTLQLKAGQIYYSKIDLNNDAKPTLRVAVPVAGADNIIKGLVVVGVNLDGLFESLRKDLPDYFHLYLANKEGDYLIHPNAGSVFGFDHGRRHLIQDEYPQTAKLIESDVDKLILKQTGTASNKGPMTAAFFKIPYDTSADDHYVVLGLTIPLKTVLADADRLFKTTFQAIMIFSLLGILVTILMSKPLRLFVVAARRFLNKGA